MPDTIIVPPVSNPAPIKYPAFQLDTEQTIELAHALAAHVTLSQLELAKLQRAHIVIQVVRQPDGGFVTIITAEQNNLPEGWTPVVPEPPPIQDESPTP